MKCSRFICTLAVISLTLGPCLFAQHRLEFHFAYRPSAFEIFKKNIDNVSVVSPEAFIVDASGLIYGELEPRLLQLAKEHNIRIMPQVKNMDVTQGLFRKDWVHAILNEPQAGERTIRSMVDLCKRFGLWGIQLDLENVNIDDRDALTTFCRKAAEALHDGGYKISVAVVHRAEEYAGANTYTQWMMKDWRGAYNLKAIGEFVDFVKIMSYGQHTRRTTPGPSQGLPWLEQVIRYFLLFVPPQKLSLGITMGGALYYTVADTALYYQNARSWSKSISAGEAESLIAQYAAPPLQWDDRQKVSYTYIERGGLFEWIMIDNDLRSLDAKLDLVRRYKLRAINMWISGSENPGLWDRIRDFKY